MTVDVHIASRRIPWSKRVDIALLCFVALIISYCDRGNLAIATPEIMKQYHWNTVQMGWILSGFFLGYTCCLIPAGLLVQRLGALRVLGLSVASWSLVTALTPVPKSIVGMYSMRVLLGICESGTFPAINALLAEWFSAKEYARAAGFCWSGGYAGPIIAFPLGGIILQTWGWRAVFFIFGASGVVWLVAWSIIVPERSNLQESSLVEHSIEVPASLHWTRLLFCPAVWALLILHFSSNWFAYVLLSWLPTYLQDTRHFSVASTAFGSAAPFAAALFGTNVFAVLIDKLSLRYPRTAVRKSFLGIYLLGGIALLALPHVRSAASIIGILSLGAWLIAAATPIYASGSLDLAPQVAATLVGIQVSFANLAGILAPIVSGYLVKTFSWSIAFAVTAAICTTGAATYVFFGRAAGLILREQTAVP